MRLDLRRDDLSVWFVCAVTGFALLLGWMVKTDVQNTTRPEVKDGLTVNLPPEWIVDRAPPDAFLAAFPAPTAAQRNVVNLIAAGEDVTLSRAAAQRNLTRARALSGYRVLDQAETTLGARLAYVVEYAYVQAEPRSVPEIIRGVEYLFRVDDQIVATAYEAEAEAYEALAVQFERWARLVQYDAAGGEQ